MELRPPPRLTRLNLDCNAIGDSGAVALAAGLRDPWLAALQVLSLAANVVADRGAAAISEALAERPFGALRSLVLRGNRVGDDGMHAFAEALVMGAMSRASYLGLDDNPFTAAGADALRARARSGRSCCSPSAPSA